MDNQDKETLLQHVLNLGVAGAKFFLPLDIVIKPELAKICSDPGCEYYGQSASCPPFVAGPEKMKQRLKHFEKALFFRLDFASETMLSSERVEGFKILHEITASTEEKAKMLGYENSMGLAGGSCKQLFCAKYAQCRAVFLDGICRNPHLARPSMSGFGIDVAGLMHTAGWNLKGIKDNGQELLPICGLVLVG